MDSLEIIAVSKISAAKGILYWHTVFYAGNSVVFST